MSKVQVLSNFSFHGHLAIITHMSGNKTRWSNPRSKDEMELFYRVNSEYVEVCNENRRRIERDAQRYWFMNLKKTHPEVFKYINDKEFNFIINNVYQTEKGQYDEIKIEKVISNRIKEKIPEKIYKKIIKEFQRITKLPPYYQNPICGVGFGHTDNITIALTNTFYHASLALENSNLPIHQMCVSFCPDIESLGISTEPNSPFCDISDLFTKDDKYDKVNNLPVHPAVVERPLIAITYYRFNPSAVLGSGLLFQEAVIRAIAKQIKTTLNDITYDGDLIKETDKEKYLCTFLCPIGWADLCTVMFAPNYSIIIAMLRDIRKLTFEDLYLSMDGVYGDDNKLKKLVEELKLNYMFATLENHFRSNKTEKKEYNDKCKTKVTEHLSKNHVFNSTSTTLLIENTTFLNNSQDIYYHGYVSADPHVNISPGHIEDVCCEKSLQLNENNLYNKVKNLQFSEWLCVGAYDSSDKYLFLPEDAKIMKLTDLLKRIKKLRGTEHKLGHSREIWPLQDLYTEIYIPLPIHNTKKTTEHEHLNIPIFLDDLKERIFNDQDIIYKFDQNTLTKTLNIRKLRNSIIEMRLPWPLSNKLIGLFVEFSKCLNDSYLLDNVLDLYELYAAVYRIFTVEWPQMLKEDLNKIKEMPNLKESKRYSFFNEIQIQEIIALIELMENALKWRTQIGFKKAQRWQEAIDMRGGLNKLVNAADVPLRCGFSILRRVLQGQVSDVLKENIFEQSGEEYPFFRMRFGGASKISYHAGAVTQRYNLGNPKINFIADLSLNIAHLTRPSFLLTHIHETGHLLCDILRKNEDIFKEKQDYYCKRKCLGKECFMLDKNISYNNRKLNERIERYDEIFSDMFTYCLLAHGIEDFALTYFRYQIATYFFDPVSMNRDDQITILRFAEITFRLFMAIDPSDRQSRNLSDKKDIYKKSIRNKPDVQKALNRYIYLLEESGPLFFDFHRLWGNKEVKKYIIQRFKLKYRESFYPICCMWEIINNIIKSVCAPTDEEGVKGTNPPENDNTELLNLFKEGYKQGRPILRFLYEDPRWLNRNIHDPQGKAKEKRGHLDAVYVMRNLLRIHIEKIASNFDFEKETCYSQYIPLKGMSPQMLDRGRNGLRIFKLEDYEIYLKGRACLLNTLWDLSTTIRARILKRIIATQNYNSSELERNLKSIEYI